MSPATKTEKSKFEMLLPEIQVRLKTQFNSSPEQEEECKATAVGHAFMLFLSATRRNKKVTPGTLAFYAVLMTRSGRRVGTGSSKYDAFSSNNPEIPHPLSLDENDLSELLSDRTGSWPVADRACFEMDWKEFMSQQTEVDRQLVAMLAQGYRRCDAAEAIGLSRPAVTYRMQRLQEAWEEYQGNQDS